MGRLFFAFCVIVSLAGCSSSEQSESSASSSTAPTSSVATSSAPSSSSAAPAQPTTIEQVWSQIGCTRSTQILPSNSPTGTRNGYCVLYGKEGVFFYEFASDQQAQEWLRSGELEIGANDAVYNAGSVIVLAQDAATARKLAGLYPPYSG
ncbi:MAG: hypothetical protein SV966_01315 [Actinomycetota bacterium]|nr:hypothetical protein [Actinomycetota bacterium]